MLKARKNVVGGKDKTKALDQNDLRNKVLDELDISDSDRGEAKKIFNDVIEKLEKQLGEHNLEPAAQDPLKE